MKKKFFELLDQDITLVDFIQEGADAGYTIKNLHADNEEWSSPKFWKIINLIPKDDNEHAALRLKSLLPSYKEKEEKALTTENKNFNYLLKLKKAENDQITLGCKYKKIESYVIITYAHLPTNIFSLFNKDYSDLSKNLVLVTDINNRFEYMNKDWLDLFSYSEDYFFNKTFLDFLHKEDIVKHQEKWEKLWNASEKKTTHTSRIKKGKGEYLWIEWESVINDTYNIIFSIGKNVTVRKNKELSQAKFNTSLLMLSNSKELKAGHFDDFIKILIKEAALQLKVNRFSFWRFINDKKAIQLQILNDGEIHFYQDGIILNTESFPNYFEVISKNRTIALTNDSTEGKTSEYLGNYFNEFNIKSLLDVEVKSRDVKIGVLCAETTKEVRHWEYEEQNYLSSLADIVSSIFLSFEKNKIINAFGESEALYKSMINALPHFIYRTDLDGKVTFVNDAIVKDLGLAKEEIVGKIGHDFFPEELSKKYKKDDEDLIKNKTIFRDIELHFFKEKDAVKYVEVVKMPLMDAKGNVEGIQGIYWDVTEFKSKEISKNKLLYKLKQQNKELEEIRNDLEFVNNFSKSILTKNTLEEISNELTISANNEYHLENCLVFIKNTGSVNYSLANRQIENKLPQSIANNIQYIETRLSKNHKAFEFVTKEQFSNSNVSYQLFCSPINVNEQLIGFLVATSTNYSQENLLEKLTMLCSIVAMRIQHSRIEIKQRETDKAFSKSKEQYASILDSLGEGVVMQNMDDKIEIVNEAALRILELSENQLLGKDSYDPLWQSTDEDGVILTPEKHPSMVTLKTGKPVDNFVMNVRTGNNKRKFISINSRPVKDQNNVLYGAVASFTDITEKKIAEAALKTSEERFKSLFVNLPIGVLVLDRDGNVLNCNTSLLSILDCKAIELKNKRTTFKKYYDAFTDLDGKKLRINELPFFRSFADGKNVKGEIVCLKLKKEEKYHKKTCLQLSSAPILSRENEVQQVVCSVVDITKLKYAEEEMLRLAHVAEKSGEIILTCNDNGEISWVNSAIFNVLGYKPESVIGINPAEIIRNDETNESIIEELLDALKSHLNFSATLQGKKEDGEKCWISYEVTPIFENQSRFLYSIVVMKDDTELFLRQKQLEKLLKATVDQNDRLREYSYITSHNIRSSVANIMALSSFLLNNPDEKEYITHIHNTINKLDKTLKNINQLLNLEEDVQNEEFVFYQLLGAVKRVIGLNQEVITEKKAKILVNIPEDLHLTVIPAYLDSILHNLISNALKYGITDTSKKIEIRSYVEKDKATILVKDYGFGIDTIKFKEKLFKLGSRFHEQLSDGQGMGLFMTKRQVEFLGGSISVESKKGLHTIFKIELQVHDQANIGNRR